jgi:hypothetical protein
MTRRGTRDDRLARTNGFAAIESYGAIGDGESVAVVARDGATDWWAAPAMDSLARPSSLVITAGAAA